MTPKRIQRQRTKGWRMPPGAVYVGRPSRWGNPFLVGESPDLWYMGPDELRAAMTRGYQPHPPADAARVVDEFRNLTEAVWIFGDLATLRGHDLACWCPLDQPCHADVLLELANRDAA